MSPISSSAFQAFQEWTIKIDKAQRLEKLLWSNCVVVELMSFIENDIPIRVIVKKSRLDPKYLEVTQNEYNQIKNTLGDMVPSQVFFIEKTEEWKEVLTAFCAPISIAYDIFVSDTNFAQLQKESKLNPLLQHDIDTFIQGFRKLREEGFIVDLFGEENLVLTREWRLKYIDSFLVNMGKRVSLRSVSEERFAKFEKLGTQI